MPKCHWSNDYTYLFCEALSNNSFQKSYINKVYHHYCACAYAWGLSLTWRAGRDASQYQTPQHPLRLIERNRGSLVPRPAGIHMHTHRRETASLSSGYQCLTAKYHISPVLQPQFTAPTHTHTHLMRCPFMLCYPLGILAALRGRELGHSDLSVPSTHGQGGVSTVGQELSLRTETQQEHFHFLCICSVCS